MDFRQDAREEVRDVILTLLLPPIGLLFVGRGLVDARRRPTDLAHWALAIVLAMIGLWLTVVIVGLLLFAGQSSETFPAGV